MIGALMIDVDGVLVCGRPLDGKPWASAIEADLGVSKADLQRAFFDPYWNDIVTGRLDIEDILIPVLAEIAPHLPCQDFITYWFENDARLNARLLDELGLARNRGIKIFLATNQEHLRASYLVEKLGLGLHIDGIYYSAALGCRKPDCEFFEQVASSSGFSPGQLLLVDDTPTNVSAAKRLGWNAVEWAESSSLSGIMNFYGAADSPDS